MNSSSFLPFLVPYCFSSLCSFLTCFCCTGVGHTEAAVPFSVYLLRHGSAMGWIPLRCIPPPVSPLVCPHMHLQASPPVTSFVYLWVCPHVSPTPVSPYMSPFGPPVATTASKICFCRGVRGFSDWSSIAESAGTIHGHHRAAPELLPPRSYWQLSATKNPAGYAQ